MGGPQYSSRLSGAPAKTPNQIRHYRLRLELTQHEVARNVGVAPRTLASWERGATCPVGPLLLRLAKTLDTLAEALYPQYYLVEAEDPAPRLPADCRDQSTH